MRALKAVLFAMILLLQGVPVLAEFPGPSISIDAELDQRTGFGVFEATYSTVYFQDGVPSQRVTEIGSYFDVAHGVVGVDLAYPNIRPRIYAYRSMEDLSNDLVEYWGYPEWIRTYRVIPRMNAGYEMWVPPGLGADFIGHEYSHRVIEQIAGLNSQVNYKWFDEGLATEEGVRTLSHISPNDAAPLRAYYRKATKEALQAGTYIPLNQLTTEAQWQYWMQGPNIYYIYYQTAAAMEYMANGFGMPTIQSILIQIGQGNPFPVAFETVLGKSVDQFEAEFLAWLPTAP